MSDSESDSPPDDPPFIEHDDRETQLGYGEGRMPLVIAFLWVALIVVYLAVMITLALPDFRAWAQI